MIDAKKLRHSHGQSSAIKVASHRTRTHPGRVRSRRAWPHTGRASLTVAARPTVSRGKQIGHFAFHYGEMCVPMCIGFAVGDLVYVGVASLFGYSKPFSQLPVLSVLVVTFSMTAPMTAWMLFRGMPRRPIIEMSAVMPILAVALLVLGWAGVLSMSGLALAEHGLMMPVMLIPMLFRLAFYTGRSGHAKVTP